MVRTNNNIAFDVLGKVIMFFDSSCSAFGQWTRGALASESSVSQCKQMEETLVWVVISAF